jgi:3'-phosphoadenosine 5'-phosphosulfate sulfotransferase (PAPS reductase)/FAD synthetase
MKKLRSHIKELIKRATKPAVMCSFGKDSLLLLCLAREFKPDIDVLWFPDGMNREQKRYAEKIIKDWDLTAHSTVYAYAPVSRYFLPNEEGLTLVDEYLFGEQRMPLLTDIAEGSNCAANISREKTECFVSPWDVILHGYKETDWHFISNGYFPAGGFQLGDSKLYMPLRHWTDGQVLQAIKDLGIDYEQIDDSLPLCTRCLTGTGQVFCPDLKKEIPAIDWNQQEALQTFRERFL